MTQQITIPIALMEQLVEALERVSMVDDDCDILSPSLTDAVEEAITAGRAALANAERVEPKPKEYTMGNWFNDLDNPHANR